MPIHRVLQYYHCFLRGLSAKTVEPVPTIVEEGIKISAGPSAPVEDDEEVVDF